LLTKKHGRNLNSLAKATSTTDEQITFGGAIRYTTTAFEIVNDAGHESRVMSHVASAIRLKRPQLQTFSTLSLLTYKAECLYVSE